MNAQLTVDIGDLPSIEGKTVGPSSWRPIIQDQINQFADLTGDHNPIHVDPEAAAASPFGTTISHGYLTLSLLPPHLDELLKVNNVGTGVNYGLNKLRFPTFVPAGAAVRTRLEITKVVDLGNGFEVEATATLEVEKATKPAVVAEMVLRYYR